MLRVFIPLVYSQVTSGWNKKRKKKQDVPINGELKCELSFFFFFVWMCGSLSRP
jgi:hypothetical protein